MDIRELRLKEEFECCVELQRTEWSWSALDIVPVRSFVVVSNIGGLTLGAFDEGRIVGFVNALPGVQCGQPYWFSRMMGIEAAYRGRGVGTALKNAQREQALHRGIDLIKWTFDPLESRNAYLNLEKLGVVIREYCVNHYGFTSSHLQRGMESDRLIVEWWLNRSRVPIGEESRRIGIVEDVQTLKDRDLDKAIQLQLRVRKEFQELFKDGYMVVGFERLLDHSEYILRPVSGTDFES